ncbi:hypothetical protein [Botryobacter ruber]|uniref:hypothetical protein n=1 Tax=Botryobacter ruber TaxID=2171629 RepID=UPI000E0C5466|nr:hypothetical protein [Botryobacter ruber]
MKTIKCNATCLPLSPKDVLELEGNYLAVSTNWGRRVYNALRSVSDLLQKYEKLVLVLPAKVYYPLEYVQGFLQYCHFCQVNYAVMESTETEYPVPETAYFTLTDTDLASLIKVAEKLGHKLGEEWGVLSLGDSPIKKLMGLTVITTGTDEQQIPLYYSHPSSSKSVPDVEVIRRTSL